MAHFAGCSRIFRHNSAESVLTPLLKISVKVSVCNFAPFADGLSSGFHKRIRWELPVALEITRVNLLANAKVAHKTDRRLDFLRTKPRSA